MEEKYLEGRHFVKVACKDEYSTIYDIVTAHGLQWKNKEDLDDTLRCKNPKLWLVEINLKKQYAKIVTSHIGCASLCGHLQDKILKTDDVKALF